MNINRNNYEEYFLLYADKELSADEKNIVEMFVRQNPDLEEEFVMLKQSVLKSDNTIELADKSSLFKKEQFIYDTNYKEKFLLYTDNELSLSERKEIENFVLSNTSLQHEFTLLQQLKFEPDTSNVFPDKKLLYKKEDDIRTIPFRKALAAAVLLGIGLWTGINYLQKDKADTIGVVNKNNTPNNISVRPTEQKRDDQYVVKTDESQKQSLHTPEKGKSDNPVTKQQKYVALKNIQSINGHEVNEIPRAKNEEITKVDAPNQAEVSKITNGITTPVNPAETDKIITPPVPQNQYAQIASYIEEAGVKSENYVFYNITTEEFKKSKVGNFLKKIKRVVSSKIPFKNSSLKIGKVEIAKDEQN